MPGYGALGFLGISKQNSFLTATASLENYPIISEGLSTKIEQLYDEGMRGRFGEGPTFLGLETIDGDIAFEAHPIGLAHFLRGVTGVCSSATLAASGYKHNFFPRQVDFDTLTALPPYTVELYRGVGLSWQLTDTVFNKVSLEFSAGKLIRATFGAMARVSSLMTKSTPTFVAGNAWTWNVASISLAGAAVNNMSDITVTLDQQIEGISILDATRQRGRFLRTGFQQVRATGTMIFDNQSHYANFYSGSEMPLSIYLAGPGDAGSYNTLLVDVPNFRFAEHPVAIDGPGRLNISFAADGKFNETSNYAIQFSLVNTRAAY